MPLHTIKYQSLKACFVKAFKWKIDDIVEEDAAYYFVAGLPYDQIPESETRIDLNNQVKHTRHVQPSSKPNHPQAIPRKVTPEIRYSPYGTPITVPRPSRLALRWQASGLYKYRRLPSTYTARSFASYATKPSHIVLEDDSDSDFELEDEETGLKVTLKKRQSVKLVKRSVNRAKNIRDAPSMPTFDELLLRGGTMFVTKDESSGKKR